ncbi:innexin inx3 [Anabrus simplex]|uniref:innexin inx3 n=1 Tax=Anabrus simplex TaxID=316456 RepID=UPI0035A2F76A
MSMLSYVSKLGSRTKVQFLEDKPVIDNSVFRCHYRFTSMILFLFCILSTANSLIGPPIECLYDEKENKNFINVYCWITSTYTYPHLMDRKLLQGKHYAHPGVGPDVEDEHKKRFVYYYQWVPFVLFLQGIAFYTPHWIWKNIENRKVKDVTDGIRGPTTETMPDRKEQQRKLVQYFLLTIHRNNLYALWYYLCEFLNFINVVVIIFLTDKFLGGQFLTYGIQNSLIPQKEDIASSEAFPKVTKCVFHRYGPSGTIQRHDYLCVLATNIINEKIFYILWFWFIILAVLSALAVLYSTAIILFPAVRKWLLQYRFKLTASRSTTTIVNNTQVGDFCFLHMLGRNINANIFKGILEDLSDELGGHKHI